MMQAAIYGRLGQDPRSINTKSGKPMCIASIAVDVADGRNGGEQSEPLWLGVVAFGRQAEDLLRHAKGDLVSVSGRVQRNKWTAKDGTEREQLQIVADSIISAKSVRPRGGRRKGEQSSSSERGEQPSRDGAPFDDHSVLRL